MKALQPGTMLNALRAMGPYVALELFMPGGTVLALLLWFARNRRAARALEVAQAQA
ncbi:MAG: hypothetical protein JWO70_3827 [Betaproteobacteria bacterium]|nr:hypothetical protein [Betaproteobacteria bacterium]